MSNDPSDQDQAWEQATALVEERGYRLASDKWKPRYLKRFGFRIETLLDVGVANGTRPLYRAFPDAALILFEPQDLGEAGDRLLKEFPSAVLHAVALGSEEGMLELNVMPGRIGYTSALERTDLTKPEGVEPTRKQVPMKTLDSILNASTPPGPCGLKIDTEGFELDVLRGAVETLKQCEFVICEVSIKARFKGSYRYADVIAFMAEQGFSLLDVLNGHGVSPRFLDCLFVRSDDPRLTTDIRDYPTMEDA